MAKILIVDDEKAARFGMKKALQKNNYEIEEATNGHEALQTIQNSEIDLVFLDLNMPVMGGMEVLSHLQTQKNAPIVIVVTAYGTEKIAVEAMKRGAYDYLTKPYDVDELRLIAQRSIEKISLTKENQRLQQQIKIQESFGEIIGQSQAIKKIYDLIEKVANTDVTVLICGESGTGKELVAREIHKHSNRRNYNFIATNCAALPENLIESELFGHEKGAFTSAGEQRKGKVEEAHKGTLFLDEIGDMSLHTQAKILRLLQNKTIERLGSNHPIQVDVRFIAATNKDLVQEIEDNNFREDLYYRIKVLDIYLPPLRERGNDITLLTNHFLTLFSEKYNKNISHVEPDAMKALHNYHWPGNVRQLRNVLEKSILLAMNTTLTLQDLPSDIVNINQEKLCKELNLFQNISELSFRDAKKMYVQNFERKFITQRLRAFQGNISQTANSLEIPRQSLQQKLKELEIQVKDIL
ncbi:MAG TPA: sigma-54 dependent transcriptional regulator [Planctomycetota bacterium]|nr:sigma-54 dependent transcriptional regulator [Planctomycetota bacterium]